MVVVPLIALKGIINGFAAVGLAHFKSTYWGLTYRPIEILFIEG